MSEFSVNGSFTAMGVVFVDFCQNDRFCVCVLPGEHYFYVLLYKV